MRNRRGAEGVERARRRSRRTRLLLAGVALAAVGAAWAVWAASREDEDQGEGGRPLQFSEHISDLPIMPGLREDDAGYAFDLDAGGRLAEVRLFGGLEPSSVRGFYAATLAQLGWKASPTEPYVYRRGRERLIFLIEPRKARRGFGAAGLDVVFVVTPEAVRPPPPLETARR